MYDSLGDAQDFSRLLKEVSPRPIPPLPERYGQPVLTLMVRDPHWIFAYWEVSWEPVELQLFLVDPTGAQRTLLFSRSVAGLGTYYLEVPESGRHYVARLYAEGHPSVESRVVRTPPGHISGVEDASWLTIHALNRRFTTERSEGSSPHTARWFSEDLLAERGGSHTYAGTASPNSDGHKNVWRSIQCDT